MRRKGFCALVLVALFIGAAAGQAPEGYLDVFVAKVKPEKRAEFDAVMKKIVDANRRHKGDVWIAAETIYGDWNTVYFTSLRQNYAEAEKAFEGFFGALAKAAGGQAGGAKMWQDVNNCLAGSRAELRRRRMDLSSNAPTDAAATLKLVGESRWVRTTMVRVRAGRTADVEDQLKALKSAREKGAGGPPTLVSQSGPGQAGTVFYITTLASSMAAFDTATPPAQQVLGESGYQRFMQVVREAVLSTETIINRYVPELSNPPEQVVSAAPDFWKPKPAAPKPKPKAEPPKTQ